MSTHWDDQNATNKNQILNPTETTQWPDSGLGAYKQVSPTRHKRTRAFMRKIIITKPDLVDAREILYFSDVVEFGRKTLRHRHSNK